MIEIFLKGYSKITGEKIIKSWNILIIWQKTFSIVEVIDHFFYGEVDVVDYCGFFFSMLCYFFCNDELKDFVDYIFFFWIS
jgi:hypothetical protein